MPRLGLGESHPLRNELPFDSHQRRWSRWSPSICLAPDLSGPVKLKASQSGLNRGPDTCTLSQEPLVTAEGQQVLQTPGLLLSFFLGWGGGWGGEG